VRSLWHFKPWGIVSHGQLHSRIPTRRWGDILVATQLQILNVH